MIWGPNYLPNRLSAFPVYHRLGVNVYEMDLDWALAAPRRPANPRNPADPAYHWPPWFKFVMQQAAQYRISVSLLVQDSPGWANGHRAETWAPNNADYANFLIAAARKYPAVHHWMIWGEPDRPGNFQPMPANSPVGPRRYATLLNAAYGALKSVSRNEIVIGGDTETAGLVLPGDFLRWMRLPNGKPPRLDYFGHDPYSRRFPERGEPQDVNFLDIDDIATLERDLRQTYDRTIPLWLAEYSISTNHANRAFTFYVSRPEQAKWLTAAFKLVNSYDFVAGLGWYDLLDQAPPGPEALTTGLMTYNEQPKPAFYAYAKVR